MSTVSPKHTTYTFCPRGVHIPVHRAVWTAAGAGEALFRQERRPHVDVAPGENPRGAGAGENPCAARGAGENPRGMDANGRIWENL